MNTDLKFTFASGDQHSALALLSGVIGSPWRTGSPRGQIIRSVCMAVNPHAAY
jgi:hypothetical protein